MSTTKTGLVPQEDQGVIMVNVSTSPGSTLEVPTEDLKSKDSYYSFHLPDEVNRVKGVTAIILKETPDEK